MVCNVALLQPVIVLSIINESNCLEIKAIEDMLSNKLNYSVVVSTPYQNHVINWTTSNSVLCNYDIDLSYEFTVTNIDCPYSDPPVPSFYYSECFSTIDEYYRIIFFPLQGMRCPFFVRSIHQVSIEYNIYTQEGMSALILCADNTYLFMECGVDDMWQSNDSCSSNGMLLVHLLLCLSCPLYILPRLMIDYSCTIANIVGHQSRKSLENYRIHSIDILI